MTRLSVVGGGLGGLVAAIAAREVGLEVVVYEAKGQLGGRARSTPEPRVANWGPHALYADGSLWAWLCERDLLPPVAKPPLRRPLLMRRHGELRRVPPLELLRGLARTHGRTAPVDRTYADWVTELAGPEVAHVLSHAAGVFSFDHDPGRLSAAFVHERMQRVYRVPSPARFVVGGWSTLVAGLERRARELGVAVETGARVNVLPEPPVVVALSPARSARLLGDPGLAGRGTRTALLDVALTRRRGDPYIVLDLDASGWIETYTFADASLAPAREHLVQAQAGLAPGEALDSGVARIEAVLDLGFADRRDRETWRRRAVVTDESGALDLPGATWRDRPAVARGDGVHLVGDMVAARGLLGEVSANAALAAVRAVTGRRDRAAVA